MGGGEGDLPSSRRPHGSTDGVPRVLLKGDLAEVSSSQVLDPDVAVAAAVGEECYLGVVGRNRGRIDTAALLRDSRPLPHILHRIGTDGKFPDIELHVAAAGDDLRADNVGIFVNDILKSKLLRFPSFRTQHPQLQSGKIEDRAPSRGAVDN